MSLASCAASSNGVNRDAKRDRDRARPRRSNKVKTRRVSQHTDVAFVEPTLSKPLSRPAPSCDAASLPGLIVYDLDDTIWFPELYMIAGAPFVKTSKSTVVDSGGARLGCYPAALASVALAKSCGAFRERGTLIAVASRTHRGKWARELMDAFEVRDGDDDARTLAACVDFVDIASGSKTKHFARLREKSGVPYAEMLFFDNERENIDEVARLGVACVHCPGGLSADAWRRGLTFFVDDVVDP